MTGDSEHKPYICGDADHSTFPLDGTEAYLILACDRFYDTVSPHEAVRVVSDHLEHNATDSTMVAHKLVASARDAGSSDNITVIVVFLRDPRSPPPAAEEGEAAAPEEGEEEEAAEADEEDEALQGGERGCQDEGGATDAGGKGRGGWPVQQCSAPADLGYEDRMDSFTDRTSLSLLGPALGAAEEEGRVWLPPASSVQPPLSAGFPQDLRPATGLGSAWLPYVEEGPQRHPPKSCVPACQEPSSTDGLWPQAAALFGQTGRRTRRMECVSPRWGCRRAGRPPGELPGLLHSGRSVPYPQRCPVRRPGVALPRLPSGSRV